MGGASVSAKLVQFPLGLGVPNANFATSGKQGADELSFRPARSPPFRDNLPVRVLFFVLLERREWAGT